MKRFLLLSLLLLLTTTHSQAQMGTMKWRFNSRVGVTSALQKTRGNLRQTYEVLICAGRQGYINTGIGFYENIVVGHEFDTNAKDSVAYAFAYDLGHSFRPWGWKHDSNKNLVRKSSPVTAQYFRERGEKALSNSPEALVMQAFWGSTLRRELRAEAYRRALKAVKLAPNWSDAHYWLGHAALCYLNVPGTDITDKRFQAGSKEEKQAKTKVVRLGHVALDAYDQAEQLDPALEPYLLMNRVSAYNAVADKKSAQMIPILADAHLRAFPDYENWIKRSGQTVAEWREMWRKRAAKIAAEAGHR